MQPELLPLGLLLELPPAVHSVGYAVANHAAVIAALSPLGFADEPRSAVDKRRAEFMAGRFAASQALRRLGVDGTPGRNDDGSPRWPDAVVGSITHGAERALCAVARRGEVVALGIDAERMMAEDTSVELRRRICSASELATLSAALLAPEHELVSLVFSAKESLYKCLYPLVGRYMGFEAARVVAVETRAFDRRSHGTLTFELSQEWSATFRVGRAIMATYALGLTHVETAVVLAAQSQS
ncbi:MAG TPA: 4'-phosphopantetheinyl transferase superfamily protein [Polyangiaceae bacterium]